MTFKSMVNTIGLSFDIVGAVLLWKFALTLFKRESDGNYFFESTTQQDIINHVWGTRAGIGFLVTGFGLQFISNFL